MILATCTATACGEDSVIINPSMCGTETCEVGEKCIDNHCVKNDPAVEKCGKDVCKNGEICVNNECVKDNPSDETCGGNICNNDEICVNNECVKDNPSDETCGGNICNSDEICVNNACVKNPSDETCGGNICNSDEICVNNECVKDNPSDETCGGNICNSDEICVNNECVKDNPSDETCGGNICNSDEICVNNACVKDNPSDETCGGNICNSDEICINNACVKDIPVDDCGGNICKENEICDEDHCIDNPNPIDLCDGITCNESYECSAGECVPEKEDSEDTEIDIPTTPEVIEGEIFVAAPDGMITTRSGDTAEFTVKLSTKPSEQITVPITSSDKTIATVAPTSLIFKTNNWDTPQHVVVTGTTKATVSDKKYKVTVGPLNTSDASFKDAASVTLSLVHKDDKTNNCASGETKDDAGKCIKTAVKSIKLDSSYNILRGESLTITATFSPSAPTNQDITWKLVNDANGKTLLKDGEILNFTTNGNTITMTAVAKRAKTITITATSKSNKSATATAKIEVKPYIKTGYNNSLNYKSFIYNDSKGDLTCEFYDQKSIDVFNKDLYEYVAKKMIKDNEGNLYGTRASVVAAARFLTLRFPYDIPYYMQKGDGLKVAHTKSHYVFSTSEKQASNSEAKKIRIFGFNLGPKAYSNYSNTNVILSNAKSWSCDIKNSAGNTVPNGLECSGFVTWALRNGRMYLGDWKTRMFGCSDSNASTCDISKRQFNNTSYVNSNSKSTNPNNTFESVHTKLSRIKSSDYVKVKSLTEEKMANIKAGDLVWHGTDNGSSSGHVAMIIGINRTKKLIYIAEATGSGAGNHVTKYTWSEFSNTSKWVTGKSMSFVIKMGHVYNYYSEKYNIKENGDSANYSDLW